LISFVVPRFAALYDQIGNKLPVITVFMLALGKNVQDYMPYLFVAVVGTAFGLYRWGKSESGANGIDAIRVKLPIFGSIWLKYQVAQFSRTLSTLLTGGLPPVPSLETAARSIGSRKVMQAVLKSVVGVREGKGLAKSLEMTGVFPELSIEMIEVGESTGALPGMLNSVAEFYEEDVQTALTAALALIEPAILIVMGGVVVTILIALYLPIFNLGAANSFK
ncbi:MAG TPA: type II secretion system F family protein, partial [Acidobacteriaceae bacterium]|nr:type II secretion system F family protein [Acidobacteriaceae bacterium]